MKENIQTIATEMLSQMSFDRVEIFVEENEDGFAVNIIAQPEDSGVLIGHHGEGVDALQLLLNIAINKSNENWVRVAVNINDYRQQREEVVKNMVVSAAQNVKATGKAVVLNYLPSHERRIAHMVLSEDSEITTYSEGVGKYRRLVISLADQSHQI